MPRPLKIVQSFLRDRHVGLSKNTAALETWDRISFDVFTEGTCSRLTVGQHTAHTQVTSSSIIASCFMSDLFECFQSHRLISSSGQRATKIRRRVCVNASVEPGAGDSNIG